MDIDFNDAEFIKKDDDRPILQQLQTFEQSDAKRTRLILVRLPHFQASRYCLLFDQSTTDTCYLDHSQKLHRENQKLKDQLEKQKSESARSLNDCQWANLTENQAQQYMVGR